MGKPYAPLQPTGGAVLMPEVTFASQAAAFVAGDQTGIVTEVANAFRVAGGSGIIVSVALFDFDDNAAAAQTIYILRSNTSLGAINTPPAPSDADADEIIAVIPLATTDSVDLTNSRLYFKEVTIPVKAASSTVKSLWAAVVTAGTPTQTANGLMLRLGILPD